MHASSPVSEVTVQLPRPAGSLRRFWSSHPRTVDVILSVVYLLITVFFAVLQPLSSGDWTVRPEIVVPLISAVVVAAALVFRRTHPWVGVAVIVACMLISAGLAVYSESLGAALILYALFVYRSNRDGWIAFGVLGVTTMLLVPLILGLRGQGWDMLFSPLGALALVPVLIAALLGVSAGDRRRYIGAIVERATQLARERDQQARLATLAERARITREIHDVVAHSLSVMVSLADGAGALVERDPLRSRDAIGEIGDVGRQSLSEMRRLLGALGDDQPDDGQQTPLRPNPGLGEIVALTATFRSAGLPVVVRTIGAPPSSPALQNTIYRVVQEALTNALRYASSPKEVLVRLDFSGPGTEIEVADDGRPGAAAPSVGSGRGLIGIRERVRIHSGTVNVGPTSAGGWRVRATIPDQEEEQ